MKHSRGVPESVLGLSAYLNNLLYARDFCRIFKISKKIVIVFLRVIDFCHLERMKTRSSGRKYGAEKKGTAFVSPVREPPTGGFPIDPPNQMGFRATPGSKNCICHYLFRLDPKPYILASKTHNFGEFASWVLEPSLAPKTVFVTIFLGWAQKHIILVWL